MKVFLVSLGCDKNRVDSEEMLGRLSAAGFSFTEDEYEADVIVVNTCCFIDAAKEESIEAILDMARMKSEGKCRKLIVAGCLSERYKDEIITELPEVDAYIGVKELDRLPEIIAEHDVSTDSFKRVLTTGGHYEFLKIAEGCNKRCTYCIIPYVRGKYKSYPMEQLLEEAKFLADSGVKELILVAQETTIYGTDIYGRKALPELLEKLCEIDGFRWIRLLYTYPEEITDELLDVIAKNPKIVNYLDMPIQHISDKILKKMGRRTSSADIRNIIARIRQLIPDVAIRTSLISGFPGETDADHAELVEFVKETAFDRLGVFTYSREEGTPAYNFPDQVDEDVKTARRDEIMSLQEQISAENLERSVGRELEVFVEGFLPTDGVFVGRSYMDAPDVDGFVYFKSDYDLMSGDYVLVKINASSDYDLYGEMVEKI
ncbi:MAG: 30S ribosomal protein S12 methylthiotransferase RimO [Lachnospiraceae bacterium]|nr:30S ribosomal protein S12 methylthiotransferase RimO [Lachnospiraceae bacterium]